jgi:hypothetical protein
MFKRVILSTFSALSLSAAYAASSQPAGVKVFVREVANKDKTYSYHYRIVNESKKDIDGFEIGRGEGDDGLLTSEMFTTFKKPKNWSDAENPGEVEASVFTPKEFNGGPTQFEDLGWFLMFVADNTEGAGSIRDGQSLSGFVVQTKKREPVFTTSHIFIQGSKKLSILPQKEVLSEKELAAKPTFTKLTVSPQTLHIDQFSNQLIPFTANIEATSGGSEEPITRIHSIRCEGNGGAGYMYENMPGTQFQRDKKFFIKGNRSLREVTKNGKAECYVYIAVSNTAGNRIFKKATFFVTSKPMK